MAIKLYLILLPIFLAIDAVWIGVVMKSFYSAELGELAKRGADGGLSPRWIPAVLVYVLIPLGIVAFVRPAMGPGATVGQAAGWGALFGLITYGVYDLTNRATVEKFTLRMTLVDLAWGATICAVAAVVVCVAERWMTARLPGE